MSNKQQQKKDQGTHMMTNDEQDNTGSMKNNPFLYRDGHANSRSQGNNDSGKDDSPHQGANAAQDKGDNNQQQGKDSQSGGKQNKKEQKQQKKDQKKEQKQQDKQQKKEQKQQKKEQKQQKKGDKENKKNKGDDEHGDNNKALTTPRHFALNWVQKGGDQKNLAVTPDSNLSNLYSGWLQQLLPNFSDIAASCRMVNQTLRPAFPVTIDPKLLKTDDNDSKLEKANKKKDKKDKKGNKKDDKKKGKKDKKKDKKEKKEEKKAEKKAKKQAKKEEKQKKKDEKLRKKGKKVKDHDEDEDKKSKKQEKKEEKKQKKEKKQQQKEEEEKDKKNKKYKKTHQKTSKLLEIQGIRQWLESAEQSISQYAGCAQLALQLEGEAKPDHQTLADASYYQYQAEECYKHYVDVLEKCPKKDKQCLKDYAKLESRCGAFAVEAYNLVQKVNGPEM